MEITIKGEPEEITALILAAQGRQTAHAASIKQDMHGFDANALASRLGELLSDRTNGCGNDLVVKNDDRA